MGCAITSTSSEGVTDNKIPTVKREPPNLKVRGFRHPSVAPNVAAPS